MSVGNGISLEQLIGIFRLDGSGWGLGRGVNGDLRQFQIEEGSLDQMESVIEAVSKATAELVKEGVEVTKLHFPVLLSLKDLLP